MKSRHHGYLQHPIDGPWLIINEYGKPVRFRLKNRSSVRDILLPNWCSEVLTTQKGMPKSTTTWRKMKKITSECNLHSLRHGFKEALRVAQVSNDLTERILGQTD